MEVEKIYNRIKKLKAEIKEMKNNKTRIYNNQEINKKEYCLEVLELYKNKV